MKRKLITRMLPMIVAGAMLGGGNAYGQAGDPLGADFIAFVNGTNVAIPSFGGTIVDDPFDAENPALQFGYANWAFSGFEWQRDVGVDMTGNLASSDTLFLRILSDPANAGQPNVTLTFLDKTDDSGADDGSADLEFRAHWFIPQGLHDGQWHDIAIPLPPATWQELEDAKNSGTMDSTFNAWVYGGAWSSGGFGVALDGQGPNSAERPDLWSEFEWTNVRALGAFFDNNTAGGPIWVDNVYIGHTGLDLSSANDPAEPMTGVTFSEQTGFNSITWASGPNWGGYNVYVSESDIMDVSAGGVQLLESVAFDETLEVQHSFELPAESFAGTPFYYAVTSLSFFGVENPDVSASAGSVTNNTLPVQPVILEMTDDEATTVFNNLSAGTVSSDGFPDVEPFRVFSGHQSIGDAANLPDSDDDLSATVYVAFSNLNELFVYAEVKDDSVALGGTVSGADAWQWDSIEIGWGNYDVRDAGGSVLTSTPHTDMERGDFADYQFRIAAYDDENTGDIIGTSAFVGWSIDAEVQGGGTAYDTLADGSGNVIGYKTLSLYPLNAIQNTGEGDAVLAPPTGLEIRLVPFNIALNDDDGNGREHQTQWTIKNNADGQWWNTPNQWPAVAMAGRATAISVEDAAELPETHTLEQNYPNPFNPTTAIRFSLAQNELVTLKVFNVLGQEVVTLLDGEPMAAGAKSVSFSGQGLASGIYLYRLEAGSFVQTKQMVLLK